MNRNDKIEEKRSNCGKPGSRRNRGNNRPGRTSGERSDKYELDTKGRDNNPNWYFKNAALADQVSQLSMREFLGRSLTISSNNVNNPNVSIPSIGVIWLNPSAGFCSKVSELQTSAINQASFRLFSKLASFTGRAMTYAPQDIAMMLLSMGEVITQVEWIRRAFGLAYTYNQRNRAYPVKLFEVMRINPEDFFSNYAKYRNRFNALITRINQIPIPKSVAYFDKCAALYEKAYLDADSQMAQTWLFMPYTTWQLDESSYEQGTILKTVDWCNGKSRNTNMSVYLDALETTISKLLNSSTLNVIYADIMNYYNKMGGEVWLFDYLQDNYQVIPEFNLKMLLQIHNMVTMGQPSLTVLKQNVDAKGNVTEVLTPSNDVYPDANKNLVMYAPGFSMAYAQMRQVLVDFETNSPSVEDRIENTRFVSLCQGDGSTYSDVGSFYTEVTLADHYVVGGLYYNNDTTGHDIATTFNQENADRWLSRMGITNFDWAPIMYPCKYVTSQGVTTTTPSDVVIGDLNYFTTIDYNYLKPINDMVYLDLFDLF